MTVSIQPSILLQSMPIPTTQSEVKRFREQLHNQFDYFSDSAMDLLDALCSNTNASSVVELSLNPLFRREYSTLFKTIAGSFLPKIAEKDESQSEETPEQEGKQFQCLNLISQVVPSPEKRHFFLFGIDESSIERLFAETLEDRGMVHRPTRIKGNKPITIGHSYSMVAVLPEREDGDAPWTIPLDMSRVPTESNGSQMGIAQLDTVLTHPNLSWSDQLCVAVMDSVYGHKKCLTPLRIHENLVSVTRSRSNRVFYQSPVLCEGPPRKGHPIWYGERFNLRDTETWHQASEVDRTTYQTHRGTTIHVGITLWHNMLMRGGKGLPTHQCPFTLVRLESFDESGASIFRPMWLIVMGDRRNEISPVQTVQAYRQRFDLEHTFRFAKQNLLLNDFETPDVEHEQQWVQLVMIAYVQLWAAHILAVALPRPWETNFNPDPSARMSPSKVQQDWNRIISQLGTPAVLPKPRGNSSGRQFGQTQTPRPRMPVVKKGKPQNPVAEIAA
jgi:DDE superfamily endonuclease